MTRKITIMSLVLGIALISAFIYTGCEDDPSMPSVRRYFGENPYESAARPSIPTAVTITPESATISFLGETISFRARGGNESTYTWAVGNGNGTITPANVQDPGSDATYDATYTVVSLNPNSVIVYDSAGRSAVASITVGAADALEIVPSSLNMSAGQTANLTVIGGLPPYTGVQANNLNINGGGTPTLAGSTITYTAAGGTNGTQVLTVIDTNGDTATCSITQEL